MPLIPAAACAAALSWTPPSVEALNPAACIAAKSMEAKRKIPRVPEPGPGAGLGDGDGLGEADGLGDGDGVGVGLAEGDGVGDGDGVGLGDGAAAPFRRGRISPFAELAELPSSPTP